MHIGKGCYSKDLISCIILDLVQEVIYDDIVFYKL